MDVKPAGLPTDALSESLVWARRLDAGMAKQGEECVA